MLVYTYIKCKILVFLEIFDISVLFQLCSFGKIRRCSCRAVTIWKKSLSRFEGKYEMAVTCNVHDWCANAIPEQSRQLHRIYRSITTFQSQMLNFVSCKVWLAGIYHRHLSNTQRAVSGLTVEACSFQELSKWIAAIFFWNQVLSSFFGLAIVSKKSVWCYSRINIKIPFLVSPAPNELHCSCHLKNTPSGCKHTFVFEQITKE